MYQSPQGGSSKRRHASRLLLPVADLLQGPVDVGRGPLEALGLKFRYLSPDDGAALERHVEHAPALGPTGPDAGVDPQASPLDLDAGLG